MSRPPRSSSTTSDAWPRIVLASGVYEGGAFESTLSLARAGRAAGRDVIVVSASVDAYAYRKHVSSAMVRVGRRWPEAARSIGALLNRLPTPTERSGDEPQLIAAKDLPAAVRHLLRSGDQLVVNSVRGLELSRLNFLADRVGAAMIWYLRETTSLVTLEHHRSNAGRVIANSRPLADEAARLLGSTVDYVPSIVDLRGLDEPTVRRSVLLVNPIASHGLEIVLAMAARMPDQHFVLQESWSLGPNAMAQLRDATAALPNVEIRRRVPRSGLFRDALVTLMPHDPGEIGFSRPRTALESQSIGVPIVGHDIPGIRSVAGSEDLLVRVGADITEWVDCVEKVVGGIERYGAAAREFAGAEVSSPRETWDRFVLAIGGGAR